MSTSYKILVEEVTSVMTVERARRVRQLRVAYTYIQVAAVIHAEWKGRSPVRWSPFGDFDAGQALCVAAATKLGENPYKAPWA